MLDGDGLGVVVFKKPTSHKHLNTQRWRPFFSPTRRENEENDGTVREKDEEVTWATHMRVTTLLAM